MVLVHGLGGSHFNWVEVADDLAANHRVVAPDLAGFGITPRSGKKATIGRNRRLIDEFIDGMGFTSPVTLVGNSMGGLIAMMEAAEAPEKVAALVLVTPALPPARPVKVTRHALMRLVLPIMPVVGPALARRYRDALPLEQQVDDTLEMLCVDAARVSADARDTMLEMARRRVDMEWAIPAFVEASRSIVLFFAMRRRFWSVVDRIACPVLVVQGEHDVIVPPQAARQLQRRRPDFSFEFFSDAGHIPHIETPSEFVAVAERFLQPVRT